MGQWTRERLESLDAADPLRSFRAQFVLPEGVIYLDGNSLGALPRAAIERVRQVVEVEWGYDLIRSWNTAGWIDLPRRVGDKIAGLIGADEGEVVAADSTSVNIFKVLSAALGLQGSRRMIVTERDNFPTDLYIAQGLCTQYGGRYELRPLDGDDEDIIAALDTLGAQTAVLMLTHVNYRTGRMHDMERLTAAAHARGILTVWDLCHSVGAVPVELNRCQADFAIGCGYKYLNGGPGAPALLYVARRHQARITQPLTGWMGHAAPFEFGAEYRPAEGIGRMLSGTPSVLGLAALEAGVEMMAAASMEHIRQKSLALTDLFVELVEQLCLADTIRLLTPRQRRDRGSQVSYAHPDAYAVVQALIARDVIGDFRMPDIMRFGVAPLYLRYVDIWDAVHHLEDVLSTRAWEKPEYAVRQAVT